MPTRRQTIAGLAVAATGGAVVSAGTFTSEVSAGADMRVVVVSDLRLEPARDDEAYVNTDDDGEIRINLDANNEANGLNQKAYSEFAQLVAVINDGNTSYNELNFSFTVAEEDGNSGIVDAIEIVSERDVTESGGEFTIEHDLGPGDEVVFGIGVDLLPRSDMDFADLSEGLDLELTITAGSSSDS